MVVTSPKRDFFSGIVKEAVVIHAPKKNVWNVISNIVGLPSWVVDVKRTIYLSKIKRGIGAIRRITFDDGNIVDENIVGWKNEEYFSYIAVSGLPLRGYHATFFINSLSKNSVRVIWQSFFNSEKMTKKEFDEFVSFMKNFYRSSLRNLRSNLEH